MNTNRLIKELKKGSQLNGFSFDDIGDDHLYTGLETPMKSDAFLISDDGQVDDFSGVFVGSLSQTYEFITVVGEALMIVEQECNKSIILLILQQQMLLR